MLNSMHKSDLRKMENVKRGVRIIARFYIRYNGEGRTEREYDISIK